MSSPSTRTTDRTRSSTTPDDGPGGEAHRGDAGEQAGMFETHPWLIPVTVVVSIVVAFAAMLLLTWAAGGETLFAE
jgi:hypothetical protein